jgi:hypothetical protein
MKITLTVEDFKRACEAREEGEGDACYTCIIAQSLRRVFPEVGWVAVTGTKYILDGKGTELSDRAAEVINQFDNGDDLTPLLPMTIEMDAIVDAEAVASITHESRV